MKLPGYVDARTVLAALLLLVGIWLPSPFDLVVLLVVMLMCVFGLVRTTRKQLELMKEMAHEMLAMRARITELMKEKEDAEDALESAVCAAWHGVSDDHDKYCPLTDKALGVTLKCLYCRLVEAEALIPKKEMT